MPLTDKGVTELQEAYYELKSQLEGFIGELDSLILTSEGENPDGIDDMTEMIVDTVELFEDDVDDIYESHFQEEEEFVDDEEEDDVDPFGNEF